MTHFFFLLGNLLSQRDSTFWMPRQSSTVAAGVDSIFYFIFWLSVFFFVLITIAMIVFVFRYRERGNKEKPVSSHKHSTALELTWTIIPTILVLIIFYVGFRGYLDMTTAPRNAYEINVTGMKWKWLFTYPNGVVSDELHVPKGMPVRLILQSEDVIHSFFVPAFRLKKDAVPGRYNKLWFEANETGEFVVYCAEYCGTSHSDMISRVVVHEPAAFEKWLADASDIFKEKTLPEVGAYLFKTRGCAQCHSLDGSAATGPTFKNLFGYPKKLTDGSTVESDEAYLRESILYPQAKVVAGYQNVMPTYQGKLKDKEITALIEYMKSLSDRGGQLMLHFEDHSPENAAQESPEDTGKETTAPDSAATDN